MWIWNAGKLLPHNEHAVRASNYQQQSLLFMIMSIYFFHAKANLMITKIWNNFHTLIQQNL